MRIIAFLLLTGSTLLYFGGQAQAQIQSLSYTSKPTIIQTPDDQRSESKLYVAPKSRKARKDSGTKIPDDDPLGLAMQDLDQNAQKEIDRVFELYKALSEQQRKTAAQQPMKTESTKHNDTGNLRTLEPSKTQPASRQAVPGSFASILERYRQKQLNGTMANSINISDPEDFEQYGTSDKEGGRYNK